MARRVWHWNANSGAYELRAGGEVVGSVAESFVLTLRSSALRALCEREGWPKLSVAAVQQRFNKSLRAFNTKIEREGAV